MLSIVPRLDRLTGLVWAVLSTCMVSEGVCWIFSATVASGSLTKVVASSPGCALLSLSAPTPTVCLLAPMRAVCASWAGFGLVRLDRACSCIISRCASAIAAAAVNGAGLSLCLFPGRAEGSNLARFSVVSPCAELVGACGLRKVGAVKSVLLDGTALDCTVSLSDCIEDGTTDGEKQLPLDQGPFAWLVGG